jgi:sporulation protein YlmC with PRC-barrel domain
MAISVRNVYRSRKILGTPVRNPAGDALGEIEEIVIDLESNTLAYAVLSFGGFMGLGDKFFAVPWQHLSLEHGEAEKYFVLDVDREKLKAAPGIPKKQWPTQASRDWLAEVNHFYQQDQAAES